MRARPRNQAGAWWTALPASTRVAACVLGAAASALCVSALMLPVPAYGGNADATTLAADTPSVGRGNPAFDRGAAAAQAAERHGGRPFDHQRHAAVSCRECHGTGERHGVRGLPQCAACHHAERRTIRCAACHDAAQLAQARLVPTRMALDVWDAPRVRALPFHHSDHAGRTCQECHGTPVTLARNQSCNACHAEHHRRETHCTACHTAVAPETHRADAHLSCTAAGCHAPRSLPSAVESRSLCVLCHAAQAAHEPGRTCAECHLIPDGAALAERDRVRAMHAREATP